MTHSPQPTEQFAQHPRLAELVTALGFRRYPLFLTGLLYEEPGSPLRRATAVAGRDGDLLADRRERGFLSSRSWSCSPRADPGRFTMSEAAEGS